MRTFVWPAQFPYCLILKKKTKKKTNNRDRQETAADHARGIQGGLAHPLAQLGNVLFTKNSGQRSSVHKKMQKQEIPQKCSKEESDNHRVINKES